MAPFKAANQKLNNPSGKEEIYQLADRPQKPFGLAGENQAEQDQHTILVDVFILFLQIAGKEVVEDGRAVQRPQRDHIKTGQPEIDRDEGVENPHQRDDRLGWRIQGQGVQRWSALRPDRRSLAQGLHVQDHPNDNYRE